MLCELCFGFLALAAVPVEWLVRQAEYFLHPTYYRDLNSALAVVCILYLLVSCIIRVL